MQQRERPKAQSSQISKSAQDRERIKTRERYRKLINQTAENRLELIENNDKLYESIQTANQLFKNVSRPREGILDAEFMGEAATICSQKISIIQGGERSWKPIYFVQAVKKLLQVGNDEEDPSAEPLQLNWNKLDSSVQLLYNRTPTSNFL